MNSSGAGGRGSCRAAIFEWASARRDMRVSSALLFPLLVPALLFPGRCIRCRRELFDGDVFEIHDGFAISVDLESDVSVLGDIGEALGVVDTFDAVDPRL